MQRLLDLKDQICVSVKGHSNHPIIETFVELIFENAKPNNSHNMQSLIDDFIKLPLPITNAISNCAHEQIILPEQQYINILDGRLTQLIYLSYIDNSSQINHIASTNLYQQIIAYQWYSCKIILDATESLTLGGTITASITKLSTIVTNHMNAILKSYTQCNNFCRTQDIVYLLFSYIDLIKKYGLPYTHTKSIINYIKSIEPFINKNCNTHIIARQLIALIEIDYSTHADEINALCDKFYRVIPYNAINNELIKTIRNKISIAPEMHLSRGATDPYIAQKQAVIDDFNAKFTPLLEALVPLNSTNLLNNNQRAIIMHAKTKTFNAIRRDQQHYKEKRITLELIKEWWLDNPYSTPNENTFVFNNEREETQHFLEIFYALVAER